MPNSSSDSKSVTGNVLSVRRFHSPVELHEAPNCKFSSGVAENHKKTGSLSHRGPPTYSAVAGGPGNVTRPAGKMIG